MSVLLQFRNDNILWAVFLCTFYAVELTSIKTVIAVYEWEIISVMAIIRVVVRIRVRVRNANSNLNPN